MENNPTPGSGQNNQEQMKATDPQQTLKKLMKRSLDQLVIIVPQTKQFDTIKNDANFHKKVVKLFEMACDKIESVLNKGEMSPEGALTLYSLYQQAIHLDADEYPNAEEDLPPEKYHVWRQQKGKPEIQAMMEYISLMADQDVFILKVMQKVCDGSIQEVKWREKGDSMILESTYSSLKQDTKIDAETIDGMFSTTRNKGESFLKELLESGKLKPTDRDGSGMCPFLLAVDCEFSTDTLQYLLDKTCDLNSKDGSGDTALHIALNLENADLEAWLIEKGISKDVKNNDGLTPYD